jgi:hypothetical protein
MPAIAVLRKLQLPKLRLLSGEMGIQVYPRKYRVKAGKNMQLMRFIQAIQLTLYIVKCRNLPIENTAVTCIPYRPYAQHV